MKLGISGTLTSRSFTDRDGKSRTVIEVLANEVEFLEKKAEGHNPAAGGRNVATDYTPDNTFGDGFVAMADVSEDDLPF
jgi:single-stranded DNA-binding protein